MGRPRKDQAVLRDRLVEKVAYLAGAEARSNLEIRRILGIAGDHAPEKVSKLLRDAEKRGLLGRACCLSTEKQMELQKEIYHKSLDEALEAVAAENKAKPINRTRVVYVPMPPNVTDDPDAVWDAKVLHFGRQIAPEILEMILESQTCGVTFGRTLASIVRGIAGLCERPVSAEPVNFVPMWGDTVIPSQGMTSSIWKDLSELFSTSLATRLNGIINGRSPQQYSLHGVPAFRPFDCKLEQFKVVLEFHAQVSSYKEIFGARRIERLSQSRNVEPPGTDTEGLAHKVDMLLASVGGSTNPGRMWAAEFFTAAKIKSDKLLSETCGDIAGVWIESPTRRHRGPGRSYVDHVRDLWTCIDESVIRRCADRSRKQGTHGVVAFAVGRHRAETIIEGVKRGWINNLFIDNECADGIVDRLQPDNA